MFVVLFFTEANARKVYIYSDKGTCGECVEQTQTSLQNALPQTYQVEKIFAQDILANNWQHETSLLVIPGGQATPYADLLDGEGNRLIRSYVENGGAFLGICAGGYYGAAIVEFSRGTSLEIIKKRELAFFAGKAIGPVLDLTEYMSSKGPLGTSIVWSLLKQPEKNVISTIYYEGGGYFENAASYPNVKVIASYKNAVDNPAAIVEIMVKKGVVILSGVHFEYGSHMLTGIDREEYSIDEIEMKRKNLLQEILLRLRL